MFMPVFSVSNISGIPSVASVPAAGVPVAACVPTVVDIPFPPLLATLLLLAPYDVPAVSCVVDSHAVASSTVVFESLLWLECLLLPPTQLLLPSLFYWHSHCL
jgi:hypothetical protein